MKPLLLSVLLLGLCGCGKVSAQNKAQNGPVCYSQQEGGIKAGNVTGPGGVKDGLPCETAPQSSDELRLRGVWQRDAKGSLVCTPLADAPAPPFDVAPREEWEDQPMPPGWNCSPMPSCLPKQRHETCADKSRILLHDESGRGHCYAFYLLGSGKAWEEK